MMIETKHASIDTLEVTIQALHVNKKQMTLAVFRQLPVKKETDDSQHWGIVRYQGIFLVFSDKGHLYRQELDFTPSWASDYEFSKLSREAQSKMKYGKPHKEPGKIWDAQNYSKEYIEEQTQNRVEENCKWQNELDSLLDQIKEERAEIDEWNTIEKQRIAYQKSLLEKLPQLFISV